MEYIIGTSGWNYAHWKDKIYDNASQSEWLKKYSQIFNTVEVNNTFYRWPKEIYLLKWLKETNKDFIFTFKVPRSISHSKEFDPSKIKSFYDSTKIMGKNLGCYLIQFPPWFQKTDKNVIFLEKFLESLDGNKDNAIEFRHKSWWDKSIYEKLRKHNIGFVNVSGLEMPNDILSTADFAYVRLHGLRYETRYTIAELKTIAEKIKKLNVARTYIYFDNDQNAFAPTNAKDIREMLIK